jgi:two-component system, NarL family, response regulator NreC
VSTHHNQPADTPSGQPSIRVGLVEDQLLFRKGLKALLLGYGEFDITFESTEGYPVIARLQMLDVVPHVMLVDLSLPPDGIREYSGLHLTDDLHENFPEIKILILSVHEDENFIAQLIEHGAHGYLVKDSDPQEVREAILAVHQKGSYINQRTLKAIQNNLGRKTKPKSVVNAVLLTKREEEILQLICLQLTTEEIAEKLFLSAKTVNGHRNNLLQKTGAKNVAGLVMFAVKNNVIKV